MYKQRDTLIQEAFIYVGWKCGLYLIRYAQQVDAPLTEYVLRSVETPI